MAEKLPVSSAEKEAELLKSIFKDNDYLLKLLRSLFFGFALTTPEKSLIRSTFTTEEIREAVRKKIYAKSGDDAPIGHVPDYWMKIDQTQIIGASRDSLVQLVNSRKILLDMFDKAMGLLEDPDGEAVSLDYTPNLETDPLQVRLLARNTYLQAIEASLHIIKQIANQVVETPQEKEKKGKQNSSK